VTITPARVVVDLKNGVRSRRRQDRAEQSPPSRSVVALEDYTKLAPLDQPTIQALEHRATDWHEAMDSRDTRSATGYGRATRSWQTRNRDDVRTSTGEGREELRDRRVHATIDRTESTLVEWPPVDSQSTKVEATRLDDVPGLHSGQDRRTLQGIAWRPSAFVQIGRTDHDQDRRTAMPRTDANRQDRRNRPGRRWPDGEPGKTGRSARPIGPVHPRLRRHRPS